MGVRTQRKNRHGILDCETFDQLLQLNYKNTNFADVPLRIAPEVLSLLDEDRVEELKYNQRAQIRYIFYLQTH